MNRERFNWINDTFLKEVKEILNLPDNFRFEGQTVPMNISNEQRMKLFKLVNDTECARLLGNQHDYSRVVTVNNNWCEDVLWKYFRIKL